jgi:hypothetical protein
LQVSRLNHISAASGVAYTETSGATTLSNWTDVGPKALPKLFEAKSSSAPRGFSSSEYSGSTRTRNPSVNSQQRDLVETCSGIGLNRRQSASCDETEGPLLSFSANQQFASHTRAGGRKWQERRKPCRPLAVRISCCIPHAVRPGSPRLDEEWRPPTPRLCLVSGSRWETSRQ